MQLVADKKCLQQAKNFKYLGCEISYENGKDIQPTPAKFSEILGFINDTYKPHFGPEMFNNRST
jgi:hypothetical protein